MPVYFHSEHIDFHLEAKDKYENWIVHRVEKEKRTLKDLNFIFTTNEYLLDINRKYLNHNYYTDVITFDYTESGAIAGDIYISIDQVRLNARDYDVEFKQELSRVIIHGVLHLLGFNDQSAEEKRRMRTMEDEALEGFEI